MYCVLLNSIDVFFFFFAVSGEKSVIYFLGQVSF